MAWGCSVLQLEAVSPSSCWWHWPLLPPTVKHRYQLPAEEETTCFLPTSSTPATSSQLQRAPASAAGRKRRSSDGREALPPAALESPDDRPSVRLSSVRWSVASQCGAHCVQHCVNTLCAPKAPSRERKSKVSATGFRFTAAKTQSLIFLPIFCLKHFQITT